MFNSEEGGGDKYNNEEICSFNQILLERSNQYSKEYLAIKKSTSNIREQKYTPTLSL
jgi:hypothetical protein